MRARKGVDPDGRGSGEVLEGVEGGKTANSIYYMKKAISNKGKNCPEANAITMCL